MKGSMRGTVCSQMAQYPDERQSFGHNRKDKDGGSYDSITFIQLFETGIELEADCHEEHSTFHHLK